MKTVTDYQGNTYALDQVVAVLKGGTPHTELPLPRVPMAILVLANGAHLETLVPYRDALAAWAGKAAPAPGAPGPQGGTAGMVDAPAGVVDAEVDPDLQHL